MTQQSDQIISGAPMRIGVLGAAGQLGTCLVREIDASLGAELAFATTRADLDLTKLEDLDSWLDARLDQPGGWPLDVVINAAAFTKVDQCESSPEVAYQVNALAPATWARTLAERGVRFLHVSTDYVFPGDGNQPYGEDDITNPRTVYGKSKRAGEVAVLGSHPHALVARTSWVFGPGRNFVIAILEQAAQRLSGEGTGSLRVVEDQLGSPTSAIDLAAALVELCISPNAALRSAKGLLHLRNAGVTSWFGFAQRILELGGYASVEIEPVPTSAFRTATPRPAYSVLGDARACKMGIGFRPWEEALKSYLERDGRRFVASSAAEREGIPNDPETSEEPLNANSQEKRKRAGPDSAHEVQR